MKISGAIAVLSITLLFATVTYAWYTGDYTQAAPYNIFSILIPEKTVKGILLLLTIATLTLLLKNNLKQALKKGLLND